MKEPLVRIRLDGNGRVYCPGETLAGSYRLEGISPEEVKAVEVSVLWHTEGKGDEDLAVHDFRRLSVENGDPIGPRRSGRFSTVLPNSPLSYRGVIVKIRWCVRVRVFLARGREVLGEIPFRLGAVLPPRSATFWARARTAEGLPPSDAGPAAAGESPSPSAEGFPAGAAEQPASPANGPSPGEDRPLPKAEATVP